MKTYFLHCQNLNPVEINKAIFTVGVGSEYDLSLPGTENQILFSLQANDKGLCLIPGRAKVKVNGSSIGATILLHSCDRIEWKGGKGVLTENTLGLSAAKGNRSPLELLKELATDLDQEVPVTLTVQHSLAALVKLAEAESGSIIAEAGQGNEWELLASNTDSTKKELISHTVLEQVIQTKKPYYVESMIAHPLATNESIIGSKVFSLACVPLTAGDRIFGAIYLFTSTPGKSIRKECLDELNVLGSQMALLIAYRRKAGKPETQSPSIVYDNSNADSPMASVLTRVSKLASSDIAVLVRGETGTGKELAAKEIHLKSQRKSGPFVALNCAAVPPTLMESTLFGYVKGAFTGAHKDKQGKFAQANGGTLFLDEIGDLPLELQTKLLRVLQEKEVEAVGGDAAEKVDFRLVTATHQDLESLVQKGKFRQDLFYRINGATLQLPALRDRKSDIEKLTKHFLSRQNRKLSLSKDALAVLNDHDWPGNIRELEQVLTRASVLTDGDTITAKDLELDSFERKNAEPMAPAIYQELGNLKDIQEAFTRDYVKRAIEKCQGNRTHAAQTLGISERTLYRLIATDKEKDLSDRFVSEP